MPSPARIEALEKIKRGWLVWSNEHDAWWRANSCGYTTVESEAGRYSYVEAVTICRRADYRAGSENAGRGTPPEVMVPSPEMLAALDRLAEPEGEAKEHRLASVPFYDPVVPLCVCGARWPCPDARGPR